VRALRQMMSERWCALGVPARLWWAGLAAVALAGVLVLVLVAATATDASSRPTPTTTSGSRATNASLMLHGWTEPSPASTHRFRPDRTRAELVPIIRGQA